MIKWDPSPDFLAQAGHFLLGVAACAIPGWLWGGNAHLYGAGGVVLYGLLKEIIWDPITETENPFFWVGAIDLAWIAGGAAAVEVLHTLVQ